MTTHTRYEILTAQTDEGWNAGLLYVPPTTTGVPPQKRIVRVPGLHRSRRMAELIAGLMISAIVRRREPVRAKLEARYRNHPVKLISW